MMNAKLKMLACAAASLLLSTGAALADRASGYSGILDASYSKPNGHNIGGSIFGIGGALETPIDFLGASVEAQAGYHDVEDAGSHNNWNIGGTVFWPLASGRVGASAMYHSVDLGGGTNDTVWNYHAAGEWFAGDRFTLGAKAGGASGGLGLGGWYAGAEAVFYACPDLALSATADYAKDDNWTFFSHESDFTLSAEWLISEQTPISVYGGYSWAEAHIGWPVGTPNANILFAGLRFYLNGNGATTLVDRQRTGTTGWLSSFAPLSINF